MCGSIGLREQYEFRFEPGIFNPRELDDEQCSGCGDKSDDKSVDKPDDKSADEPDDKSDDKFNGKSGDLQIMLSGI